ncbi:MAG: response regulator [Ferruginibacter sp.]
MLIKKYHVLVIDDNEDILFMLKAMLTHKGYEISVKENTENIESAIESLSPDVILMDMLLSGSDGREICNQLKANPLLSHIPIIMTSAHPQANKECLNAGADFFLAKPFEMNDLFQTVATTLKKVGKN